jgi:putative endonuclease
MTGTAHKLILFLPHFLYWATLTAMTDHRKQLGALGERLAGRYLVQQGYKIVARNWRCPEGELDLVAQKGEELVFVEVRTRRGTRLGSPEESITAAKQARLIQLAQAFLAEYNDPDCAWHIDVVAVVLNRQGAVQRLTHIEYAIGE